MRRKRLRIASVVIMLGLIAAIPASTQVLFGTRSDEAEATNLPLLVLVNRLELTPEQMEEIHGLLAGLLEEREALELRRAELEQDLIAFTGAAEELDEILEVFRAETEEQAQAARQHAADVIDQIKEILTLKQGELLAEVFPGLLGERDATELPRGNVGRILGMHVPGAPATLRERILGKAEERFGEYPEVLEQLQERIGNVAPGADFSGRMQRGGFGMPFGGQEQRMQQGFRGGGRFGEGSQCFGAGTQMSVGRGMQNRGLDWIEQLVEVLELKLEAIG